MKPNPSTASKRKLRGVRNSRKIVVDFPAALYAETERAASVLSIDRSKLIRSAVEDYLRKVRGRKIEKALIEGYIANAPQALESAEEFVHVDSELL